MSSSIQYPKLRAVDVRPISQDGRPYIFLRDPLQLTDRTLLVPQPLASVLAFCDGTQDTRSLSSLFEQYYGLPLDPALVEHLLSALDEVYLLDNARYVQARAEALEVFRQAPYRTAALAGRSYPGSSGELRRLLNGYLDSAKASHNGRNGNAAAMDVDLNRVCGLVSPHIDYPRGGMVYAHAWQQVAAAVRSADLIVILGTDHYSDGRDLLTFTRQDYATPYGVLPTAQDVVDAAVEAVGEQTAFAGELRHRSEHSIELVTVWLHHILEGQRREIVPILTGSFGQYILGKADPAQDATITRFLEAMHTATAGRRVIVVASGDLAHVGPAFGGAPLDGPGRAGLRSADDRLIAHMCAGDATGFFASIQEIQDRNNVCGTAPIYLTMRLLGAVSGQKMAYQHCPADNENTSVVSVCGVVFQTSP